MNIKTTITSNSLASATIGDKTLTRRTEGGQVIYDAAGSGGGGGSNDYIGAGTEDFPYGQFLGVAILSADKTKFIFVARATVVS